MLKKILLVLMLSISLVACSPSSDATPVPTETPTPPPTPTLTPTPQVAEEPTPVFSSNPFNDGLTARRNGDYARAVAAFQVVLASNPSPDLLQETQYRLGEAYWLNNDDARALTALNAYLQANPNGARVPESRYLLADAYRVKKDYPNALEQLRLYRGLTPTLAGDTDAAIADVMILAGDAAGALAQYDRALQDMTMGNTARINVLMRVADLHQGRGEPELAAARYDAAFALASDARTKADLLRRAGEAYAAANKVDLAIARWNDAINKYPEQNGAYQSLVNLINRGATVDDFQRGLVDFYAGSYDAGIAAFQRELKSNAARAGDIRYFIARSHAAKGAYSQAIAEYDALIKALPKDKRVPEAHLGKAAAYAAIGKLDDAVAVYKKFAAAFPDDASADDALWRAAVLFDRAKRYGEAASLYEAVHAKYPARERASEALFWAGMNHFIGKDFKTASARWQTLTKEYPKSSFNARALFWLGKSAQARSLATEAKNYWTQATATPTNYYSWRARELLKPSKVNPFYDLARYAMNSDAERVQFEQWLGLWSKGTGTLASLDTATRNDLNFRRGAELLRLDRIVEARREFATLIAEKQDDPRALYALALYLRDNNLFSLSMDCAERLARLAGDAGAPDAPRFLWALRYPTYYGDLVIAEAQKNQVDPLLYFALIRQESSFNPWSTSSVDARGLGQVMPATGRGIAQSLGVKNFSLDQLYLPFISIRFGVWYFAQDLNRFDEPIYALAAYNAGTGRIKNWQRPDLDLAVEEIDITETASYVRIVYANWKQYQQIYK